ncbi:hypothetical protein RDABS01_028798 [Bienertia sinuspersici]
MESFIFPETRLFMDMRLKPCTIDADNHTGNAKLLTDRLTTLPDELLIGILSLLPTKDAAAACVSSKRLMCIFRWITTLDFDDSPAISHCMFDPHGIERFPTFIAFVDSVLKAYRSDYLTKFKLGVGPILGLPSRSNSKHGNDDDVCKAGCFPALKSTQINAWISVPLARGGLREIDLRIHVREEEGMQLPSEIFVCETLEVLKLDVNLSLDRVSAMPYYRLPKLKLLSLIAIEIPEGGLVTRLVSSCPLLEDLTLNARWNCASFISISSPSLRRFSFDVWTEQMILSSRDLMIIHAPKLEFLQFVDDLAL